MTLLFSSSVNVGHLMIIHRQMGCSGGFWRTQNKFSHVCHLRRMVGRLGSYGTQGQREGMDALTYWLQNGQISHMVITDSKGEICSNQGGYCVVLTTKLLKPENLFSCLLANSHSLPIFKGRKYRTYLSMEGEFKNSQSWFKNHCTCTKR